VGVGQDGTDQADHGGLVGEDLYDAGAAFDLFVQALGAMPSRANAAPS
jgi:hypothetical protein